MHVKNLRVLCEGVRIILGAIALHEMVENIKSMKTTGLERIDKFMSRFIDLEHPGKNENKRVNYYDIKKRKGCIISNCQKQNHVYNSS